LKQQHRFALLAVMALFVGLGCQIANSLADKPTPPPAQPPAVRNTVAAPTVLSLAVPTIPPLANPPVVQQPLVIESPTLPPVAPPTQPLPPPPPLSQPSVCTNPNAAITSPTMDSTVSGLLEIRGTASGTGMDYWKVEYRADAKTTYDMLNRSNTAVTDAVLARLSTRTIPDGVYFVRLVIVQKDGNFAVPCETRLTISN
jgi:hypothetical protein